MHCIISFTHLSLKPIFCIIFPRQPHSTRSKALLISSFKAISPILPLLFFIKVVHSFKGNNDIVCDEAVIHESTLVFTYNMGQEALQPVSNDFGGESRNNITETYWSVLSHSCGIFGLWNENNMCFIKIWRNNSQVQEI